MNRSVLHICSSRSWGGMEISVARLAGLQQRRGHRVMVAADGAAPLARRCDSDGIEVFNLREAGPWNIGGTARLSRLYRRWRPQIVHVHYSKDLHRSAPASWMAGRQGMVFTKHLGSAVRKRDPWHRLVYGAIRRATAISTFIRDNLIETTLLRPEQIDLVHPGTDVSVFAPDRKSRAQVRSELGIADAELVVGMMGRISPGKGFQDFTAMAQVIDKPGVRFLMIGGISRDEEAYGTRLRQEAEQTLGPRLIFLGFKQDRERYLRALDVFAFPSHAESFGLALCEAMATGLPCVAYAKDGVLDIITDGKDGLMATVAVPDDLRRKIARLLEEPETRDQLGRAARQKVLDSFSEERMLVGYEETYRKVAG